MTGRRTLLAGPVRPQSNARALATRGSVDFPVVALGASAGGLEACKRFFEALPAKCGMAFVLIQHLDPNHQSMMVDLLTSHTSMTVLQATDGMQPERDHVYLIPPGASLAISDGLLRVSKPLERHGTRMPFDFFLRSLAEECGERAICAILSGTGTDGSLGLKAVKERGGLVIVQDPEETAFDGMPRSAIMSGGVDLVLPMAKMPQALVRYGRQTYVKSGPAAVPAAGSVEEAFADIIALLAAKTSHDFSLYKPGTLQRRIERRMAMAGIESSSRYLLILRKDPDEREQLAKDLLINVTHFFRDPATFDLLADTVIPELVRQHTMDRPLRVWVPACSTGEDAYSIAMLFLEQIATTKRNIKLQVFASDIDTDCVAFARNGIYPESIEADVTPARLARFFTKEDHTYQVTRELRETVVFTGQSLLADAPFSRLDLVSCRNLLIYLNPEAQRKVLSLFHFSLRAGGVLLLGSSETIGSVTDRFEPISKKHRIYRHIGRSRPGEVEFPLGTSDTGRSPVKTVPQQTARRPGLGELSQRVLLDAYAPPSVLINDKLEGLYYCGSTDRYLKIASGEGSWDVLAMARDGLRAKLKSAIKRAKQDNASITLCGPHVKRDGRSIAVSVAVRPIECDGKRLFLVSFIDDPTPEQGSVSPIESSGDASRVAHLEQELQATREDLQSAIRDLEIANEEQKAINEEAMSTNEEFQSTNEELETSKEELQSLNEELTVLNAQLHETIEQQRATSDDLQNILNSTDVATLFLDGELNIRFFTPAARSLFNVIASDVGRPLADFTRRFIDDHLLPDARAVLTTHAAVRREVKADDGSWFIRGMLPYRSGDSHIKGVVISLAGISEIKAAERALEAAKSEAERANVGKSRFLAAASHDLRQPLQTISLLQGTLEKRVRDEATLKLVHRLDETVAAMSSMLDKLLDINQLEAGNVRPAIVDFPIKTLLEELIRTEFTYHTAPSGLDWRVVLSSLPVKSDPRLLEQIIRNLLSNAVKYTTEGKLLLGCRRRADKLRIEVWDTGPGIPELELKAIFWGIPSARQPRTPKKQGPRSWSRHREAPCRPARTQDGRSLSCGRGLGFRHRGATWESRGIRPADPEQGRDPGEPALPWYDPDRRRRSRCA
jgi:two-component system, chemotaxis family, CheB/CheR fusion protein